MSNPIYLGLGTAAITALSAAVPLAIAAAEPSPSASMSADVSDSPSPGPSESQAPAAVPKLVVLLDAPGSAHGGDSVKVSVEVFALEADAEETSLSVSAPGATVAPSTVQLDTVKMFSTANDVKTKSATVTIPKSKTSGTVTVTAEAISKPTQAKGEQKRTITITKRPSSSTGSNGSSGNSGSSGGTGSSGGSTGVGGIGSSGTAPSLTDPGFVPASPAGALNNPQVALPQIAPQAPVTAPTSAAAAPNTLRSGGIPGSQELTFERLASTQAAWLAALLVAFSLLLTQLRMVRPYNARLTGDHRRPRHGLFQR